MPDRTVTRHTSVRPHAKTLNDPKFALDSEYAIGSCIAIRNRELHAESAQTDQASKGGIATRSEQNDPKSEVTIKL